MSSGNSFRSPKCVSATTAKSDSNAHASRHQEATLAINSVPREISTSQHLDRTPCHKRKRADAHFYTSSSISDDLTIPDISDVRDPKNPYQSLEPFKKTPKQSPSPLRSSSSRCMPSDSFRRVLFAKELVQPNFSSLSKIDPSLFCESISNVLTPIVEEFDEGKMHHDYQHSLGGSKANVNAMSMKNNHTSLDGVPRQSAVGPGFSDVSGPNRAHALSATHLPCNPADSHESSQSKNDNQVSHVPGVTKATASDPVHFVDSTFVDNRRTNCAMDESQSLSEDQSCSSNVMSDHREYIIDSNSSVPKFGLLTFFCITFFFDVGMKNLLSSLSSSCGGIPYGDQSLVTFYEIKNQWNTHSTPPVCTGNVESVVGIERNSYGQIYSLPNLHVSCHGTIPSRDFQMLITDPYPQRDTTNSDEGK